MQTSRMSRHSHEPSAAQFTTSSICKHPGAFNTMQSLLLKGTTKEASVDLRLAAWTVNCLSDRPQYVRTNGCVPDVVTCNTSHPMY